MSETAKSQMLCKIIGRYALYDEVAAGGMATVHIGRLLGPAGFSRTVAIKRMHAHLAKDPEFVAMFMDEARLAGRIRHPNVIGTIDIVAREGELFLVMEYVHGESFSKLLRSSEKPAPLSIVSAVLVGALDGLHAAHEAKNDRGEPLHIVHRDVSPQNIMVGVDGVARILDFGIAKAADRTQRATETGQIKGKFAYMPPEQIYGGEPDRRSDIYSASVVLWEALTHKKLFSYKTDAQTLTAILAGAVDPPSKYAPERVSPELDKIVLRGLALNRSERFETARDMARALQKVLPIAPTSDVADWAEFFGGKLIEDRARKVAAIEQATPSGVMRPISSAPPPPIQKPVSPSIATVTEIPQPKNQSKFLTIAGILFIIIFVPIISGLVLFLFRKPVDTLAHEAPIAAPSHIISAAPLPSSVASIVLPVHEPVNVDSPEVAPSSVPVPVVRHVPPAHVNNTIKSNEEDGLDSRK